MLQTLDLFLTAYDPSDLPGGSIDPMGFDRGYMFLADCILPGMSNVASRPRYFSALCAGISLAEGEPDATFRHQRERRRDCALRFERLWAMANALASRREELSASGIRGITYVNAEMERLERNGTSAASAKYKLLIRQQQYGMLGMYGAIAEGMRLIERRSLLLTPDAGLRLAEAFISETKLPPTVRKAMQAEKENIEVDLDILADWGKRAHVETNPGGEEARLIREALHRDPLRSRMATVLAEHQFNKSDGDDVDSEQKRLARIARSLSGKSEHADLHAAILTILAYERCYRISMLAFERILRLCRTCQSGVLKPTALLHDEVIKKAADALPHAVGDFKSAIDAIKNATPVMSLDRIEDVYQFLIGRLSAASDIAQFCQAVLSRHADIQHGKFNRGRRKMAWIEESGAGISLTMTRAGGRDFDVDTPEKITPHFYRLGSADAFIRQGGN